MAPLPVQVDRLVALLSSRKMGVVAHFYMDPEVRCRDSGRGEIYRSSKMGVLAHLHMDPEVSGQDGGNIHPG